jgi:hypothetical protein
LWYQPVNLTSERPDMPDPIFVFGSNLAGIHGAGAALHAARWCGAVRGQGEGLMGAKSANAALEAACYAIPTKVDPHTSLSLADVAAAIKRFKAFASARPDMTFQVTRIGCGRAGFTDDQIAPLFDDAPPNCQLPGLWWSRRYPDVHRLIVAGSRQIGTRRIGFETATQGTADAERTLVFGQLDRLTANLHGNIEVVSGMASGPDTLGAEWAAAKHLSVAKFPANWKRFGKAAGMVRNAVMSWYGTHLVAFWDGTSRGTANMIETANRDGLKVRVVNIGAGLQAMARPSAKGEPCAN